MKRITYYDIEFGSYFPKDKTLVDKKYWDFINIIGQLEDKIERLKAKNAANK